jgi:hypothetical protein
MDRGARPVSGFGKLVKSMDFAEWHLLAKPWGANPLTVWLYFRFSLSGAVYRSNGALWWRRGSAKWAGKTGAARRLRRQIAIALMSGISIESSSRSAAETLALASRTVACSTKSFGVVAAAEFKASTAR